MTAVLNSPGRLLQIHYPYAADSDWTQAHGLRYMALSILVGGWGTFLFEMFTPLNPDHVIGSLAGMPVSFMRLCFMALVILTTLNAGAVKFFVERGNLRAAAWSVVVSLYLVAIVSYLPNHPLDFIMLIFSLPVTAAGALLTRKETLIVTAATVAALAALIVLYVVGATTHLAINSFGFDKAFVFGATILAVDGIILAMFAGGQRKLLAHNLALTAELQTATRAAQQAETKWRAILANAPVAVLYTDPDGVVEYANHPQGFQAVPGRPLVESLPPDQREPVAQALAAAADGAEAAFRITLRQPGGTMWLEGRAGPVQVEGERIGLAVIAADVTDRVQAAEAQARLQEQVIAAQQQALKELSTPVIPVAEGVIALPLVGAIDTARARDVTRALLAGITRHRADVAILDITGVPIVDTGVAQHLSQAIAAARLKGAHTIVSGVSDAVAEAIVDLGIDWSAVETVFDLHTALRRALERAAA